MKILYTKNDIDFYMVELDKIHEIDFVSFIIQRDGKPISEYNGRKFLKDFMERNKIG